MDKFSYLILVEMSAMGPMSDLVAALQAGYDAGAAGSFQVVPTRQPGYLVTFLRTVADDDLEYLRARLERGSASLVLAAVHQLGAELQHGVRDTARPVVEALLNGDAQVVDFNGVLTKACAATSKDQ